MKVVVKCFAAPGTVTQPMWESRTNSVRFLGAYGYSFKGLQVVSVILQMYTSNQNTAHIWCIDYCILSNSTSYYSTPHHIQHSIVCITTLSSSAKNISVWADWLRQSGRTPSEPSETPRWRNTPRPAWIPRVELHIALRSPFRRFFSLCQSPILNKHSGVVANCDHTSEWVHCVHACIRIHAIARIHEISQRASETKSWET
jgi:hypothetical protein